MLPSLRNLQGGEEIVELEGGYKDRGTEEREEPPVFSECMGLMKGLRTREEREGKEGSVQNAPSTIETHR